MPQIAAIENNLHIDDLVFYDVRQTPFSLHGLYEPLTEPVFRRIPEDVARATSEWVTMLATNTAGGRVRFKTDSPYIAIKTEWDSVVVQDHIALNGASGLDLYVEGDADTRYAGTFRIPAGSSDLSALQGGYEACARFPDRKMRAVTIHMPLYNNVARLYIGVAKDATLSPADAYRFAKPVLYYGSSITQGGCASRPGLAYQNIISRRLGCDHINLGFSGSGKAEDPIVDYMTQLDISAFVCDYDHNAPDAEYLNRTLRVLYAKMRAAHPTMPYIFVSMPNFVRDENCVMRRRVINDVFHEAFMNGDRNVWFVDGETMFPAEYRDDCTVDGCHPNDLGFMGMANSIGGAVAEALGR